MGAVNVFNNSKMVCSNWQLLLGHCFFLDVDEVSFRVIKTFGVSVIV